MAKTKECKSQEAATRKLIKFYNETFPELIDAIEKCDSSSDEQCLHNVFNSYKKMCKMAKEAGVNISLYGVKLSDFDTHMGFRWFIEGGYIWDLIDELNKAKYNHVSELVKITSWNDLDDVRKSKFNRNQNYIASHYIQITDD